MKKFHLYLVGFFSLHVSVALSQIDVFTAPLVYHHPDMDRVTIQKGVTYHTVNDTTLTCDIYYPPAFDKKAMLPVVIFNNGVGGNELPTWQIYKDWASLVAANGVIAINHQSRHGKTLRDSEALVDFLRAKGKDLNIDPDIIGIWACSANVGAGMPLAMQQNRPYIKALVMYYGTGWKDADNVIRRQDLEILLVRAGLDFYNLNKNIESFVKNALESDAHLEYINYPEGQHAFDALDNNERSKEIILQTVDFLKRNLIPTSNEVFVLTNRSFWKMVVDEKKVDEAMVEFKKAISKYRAMPNHTPWFNHVIDERNLNQMGYELMNNNRVDDAIKVFLANRDAFPDSPNVYDALGDAYEKNGNKEQAIANSKTALAKLDHAKDLNPQYKQGIRESAEGKLKRLTGGK